MWQLHPKLLIGLIISFIGFTIVGTLTHEAGHYVVAKWYGFGASIHYGSTQYGKASTVAQYEIDSIETLHRKYAIQRRRNGHYISLDSIDFPEKPYYIAIADKHRTMSFAKTLGGPVQTMLTGTIGLVLLLLNRRWWAGKQTLTVAVWLVVLTALFWLRQSSNHLMATYGMFSRGQWSARGDEVKLARHLQIWPGTISLLTGLIGLGVLAYITLRVVPKAQRFTFLLGGLIGGSLGYWIWLIWLGPIVMP